MNYAVTVTANNVQIYTPSEHMKDIDDTTNLVLFNCPSCDERMRCTFSDITIEYELEDKYSVTEKEICKKCGQEIEIRFYKVEVQVVG